MALVYSPASISSFSLLHSSSNKPPFPLSFNYSKLVRRRNVHRSSSAFTIRAAVTLNSENGAVVSDSENPNEQDYGRKFFPLAAVVGQVKFPSFFFSHLLIFCQILIEYFINLFALCDFEEFYQHIMFVLVLYAVF